MEHVGQTKGNGYAETGEQYDELIHIRLNDRFESARGTVDHHHGPSRKNRQFQNGTASGELRQYGGKDTAERCHLCGDDEHRKKQREDQRDKTGTFTIPVPEKSCNRIELRFAELRSDHQSAEKKMHVPSGRHQHHQYAPVVGTPDRSDRSTAADNGRPHGAEEEKPPDAATGKEKVIGRFDLLRLRNPFDENENHIGGDDNPENNGCRHAIAPFASSPSGCRPHRRPSGSNLPL